MSNTKIDFVVAWVDGTDEAWKKEMYLYVPEAMRRKADSAGEERYSDNGLFRYFFRGIENNAPWVNKIYFVTYGHVPKWLDTTHPKLEIVNHKDFMPKEYLPTFSFVPLALNIHRIKGLSENFVLFNDDMYLISPCSSDIFFHNGLPRDMALQDVIPAKVLDMYWYMLFNATTLINRRFNKHAVLKKNWKLWFSPVYGKHMIKNILLSPFSLFSGFYGMHMPMSYLKSTFNEVWNDFENELCCSCQNRYRYYNDITEEIVQYYQLAEGNFVPINKFKLGRYCTMKSNNLPNIITSKKYKYICINDDGTETEIKKIQAAFECIFPEKSSFELY